MKISRKYRFHLAGVNQPVVVEAHNFSEAVDHLSQHVKGAENLSPPLSVVSWSEETTVERSGDLSLHTIGSLSVQLNKDDLAKFYGFGSGDYDVSLPQGWLNELARKLADRYGDVNHPVGYYYDMVRANAIWAYPENSISGEPFYLLKDLRELVEGLGHGQ